MSSPGSPSLAIERRAGAEYGVVAAVLVVCLTVPWCVPSLSFAHALLLCALTTGAASVGFRRMGWLGGQRALRQAIWTSEGEWRLIDVRGRVWAANLLGGTLVTRFIVWLRFGGIAGKRQMILLGSGAGSDLQRRLALRLAAVPLEPHAGSAEPPGKDTNT